MVTAKQAVSNIRRGGVIVAVLSVIVNGLMLVLPLHMLQVYDRVLSSRSSETLLYITLLALAALALLGLFDGLRGAIAARIAATFELGFADKALRHDIQHEDHKLFAHVETVRDFLPSRAALGLFDAPFTPLFIVLLYLVHPPIAVATLCGALLLVLVSLVGRRLSATREARAQRAGSAALAGMRDVMARAHTARAMALDGAALARWSRGETASLADRSVAESRAAFVSATGRALRLSLQLLVLAIGAAAVLADTMSAGMIFAASIIAARALQPLDQMLGCAGQYARALAAWRALQPLREDGPDDARTIDKPIAGRIKAEGLMMTAGRDLTHRPIVARATFSLEPGTVTAMVGPSGAGKSTLARALVGAQPPTAGRVRIDGHDVRSWDAKRLGTSTGYLAQACDLFDATIGENIARLASDYTQEDVEAAAELAGVHAFICDLPHGYGTRVGHAECRLSGGERQRIALARALYGNPSIVVLDEPNAAQDIAGDEALGAMIAGLKARGATVLIITQRREIIAHVDAIMRLNQGVIEFHGTKQDLLARLRERDEAERQTPADLQAMVRRAQEQAA